MTTVDPFYARLDPIDTYRAPGCTWGTSTREPSCGERAVWHVWDHTYGEFLCAEHARPYIEAERRRAG